jgi:hypothetical protein
MALETPQLTEESFQGPGALTSLHRKLRRSRSVREKSALAVEFIIETEERVFSEIA